MASDCHWPHCFEVLPKGVGRSQGRALSSVACPFPDVKSGTQRDRGTKSSEMFSLRGRPQALPSLCLSVLFLACFVASMSTESLSPTPGPESSRWSLVRARVMEIVEPMVTKTRDRWQWFWGPEAVQGYVQAYYEDHLKDLGPRAQAWLQRSRDHLLNKTHSLCPRLLCKDQTQG